MRAVFSAARPVPPPVLFLAWVGLSTSLFLFRYTPHAVLGVFTVTAIVIPMIDPNGQLLMVTQTIRLYGLSISIAWVFGNRAETHRLTPDEECPR